VLKIYIEELKKISKENSSGADAHPVQSQTFRNGGVVLFGKGGSVLILQ